jgi:hypothetical protein
MKTLLRTLLLGMALVLADAGAQGVGIRGGPSCGTWVNAESNHKNTREGINFGRTWVIGYLSGLASATGKDFWGRQNINLLSNDSVFLWIDNYCRSNPLKNLDDAAIILFAERTKDM